MERIASPPVRRCANITGKYLSNMEEIYDKECLREGLEMIEGMTVKEIRRGLPEGYGFFIFGDSSWAILKADKAKGDTKVITYTEL